MIGLHYPDRALSLTAAGAGSGSERAHIEDFRKNFEGDRRRIPEARAPPRL